eukprot:gene25466-34017_t
MGRPKKNEAAKTAEADPGNLPWTESMDLCLLKLVNQFGAHLPHIEVDASAAKSTTAAAPKNGAPKFHSKPADRWRDLTAAFFLAPDGGLPFAERHYKLDDKGLPDYRKVRDHFNTIKQKVVQDIETGNQSGKEGDLSEKYKLVKSIVEESDEAEAAKATKKQEGKDLKDKLDNTTEDIINGKKHNANKNTAVKVKMADGSIVIDEERAAKKAKQLGQTLEGKMLSYLDTMASNTHVSDDQRRAKLSEVVIDQLQQYILSKGHCLEAFLFEAFSITASANPPFELQMAIEDLGGLSMLIEVYCSRDDNFEPGKFKIAMGEFGIGPREARIMHVRLDKWRKEAAFLVQEQEEQQKAAKRRAQSGTTSSVISDLTGATTSNNSPNNSLVGPTVATASAGRDESISVVHQQQPAVAAPPTVPTMGFPATLSQSTSEPSVLDLLLQIGNNNNFDEL